MMMPVQVWHLSVVIVGYNYTYRVEITPVARSCLTISKKKTFHSIYNDRFGVHLVVIHTFFFAMFLWGTNAESWQHGAGAVQQKRATLGWLGVDDCRLFGDGRG